MTICASPFPEKTSGRASTAVFQLPSLAASSAVFAPLMKMRSGRRPMRTGLLRHESDTVDLLECCFAGLHKPHGGIPERYRAGGARRLLQLSRPAAGDDH